VKAEADERRRFAWKAAVRRIFDPTMVSTKLTSAAIIFSIVAFGCGTAMADSSDASDLSFVKACGTITALGTTLNVDIAEGHLRTTCRQARHVMETYLTRTDGAEGGRDIKIGRKTWGCYTSRPDGVGWDYHCNRMKKRIGHLPLRKVVVDIGAGRRF
jgi:hypothetical protein